MTEGFNRENADTNIQYPISNIQYPMFEGFAQYYDQFMLKLVNYPAWVDYILKIFNEHNIFPKTILDLACGTGIPSLLFARKGYRIIGVDNSLPMLEVFKNKLIIEVRLPQIKSEHLRIAPAVLAGSQTSIIHSDIRNFSLPEKVDAAVSLYDSINYLLTEKDLASCFSCVQAGLNPNGIFTFDMNTLYCLESFWDNQETPRRIGNTNSIWRNSYNPQEKTSTLKLTIFTDDGSAFQEVHKERAYTEFEIKSVLESVGFTDIKFYAHLTLLPTTKKTLRMMIVARTN